MNNDIKPYIEELYDIANMDQPSITFDLYNPLGTDYIIRFGNSIFLSKNVFLDYCDELIDKITTTLKEKHKTAKDYIDDAVISKNPKKIIDLKKKYDYLSKQLFKLRSYAILAIYQLYEHKDYVRKEMVKKYIVVSNRITQEFNELPHPDYRQYENLVAPAA